ncbi:MAG: ATP-cone domain-containing protein [Parcubacteria group bacterium Gr01-1014_56]|nr:MAG: ATP-cone domain-containing protein [Parcubacteria group bacterium Gr01-1014_56]
MSDIFVAKADGTAQIYDSHKLVSSLRRAGAKEGVANTIAKDIEKKLWSGISTQEIYSRAFALLREHRHALAARYSLKRAVLDFGPSGFPFEAYIAELYRKEGYEAQVDQIVQGKCVDHEVDVVIQKGDQMIFAEAKFHNTAGFKTDLKVVLYVKARIDDIGRGSGLVVTNTKFTSKAIQYAECAGLELLAWDYPQHKTLHDRIEGVRLYPITALTTLSNREKTALLSDRVVLCNALPGNDQALRRAGIVGPRADTVLEEVGALCIPGADI